jgi:hypothetical protein
MKVAVMASLLAERYVYVDAAHVVVFSLKKVISVQVFSDQPRGSGQCFLLIGCLLNTDHSFFTPNFSGFKII